LSSIAVPMGVLILSRHGCLWLNMIEGGERRENAGLGWSEEGRDEKKKKTRDTNDSIVVSSPL